MLIYVLVKYEHIDRKDKPQIYESGYLSGGGGWGMVLETGHSGNLKCL